MWSRPYKLYNACNTAIGLELEEAFIANVGRKGRDVGSIQVDLMTLLRSLRYSDFIHTYRTLNVRVLRGVDLCNLFSVTMVGRRVNSFRC